MAQIKIKIRGNGDKASQFELPDTIPIDKMIPRIIEALNMPGTADVYALYHGTRALSGNLTLATAEVQSGVELRLAPRSASTEARDYYLAEANARWPALIIYLLDVSGSMQVPLGNKTRIQVVEETLRSALRTMVRRSMRGDVISPRYRVAVITYSDKVTDVYDGARSIGEIVNIGIPQVGAQSLTNTAGAFEHALGILERELPTMQAGRPGSRDGTYPAPLICHLTDGEYTVSLGDPEPIAQAIRELRVPDGCVLIENIFISDKLVDTPPETSTWTGFTPDTRFANNEYANKLLAMSSPVPKSYSDVMALAGYRIQPGSAMLYPGVSQELVEMAFQMSVSTPISRR